MRFEEFERIVKDEPGLDGALQRAAAAGKRAGDGQGDSFGIVTTAAGLGALVLLFPIVKRVLRIGLPWIETAEHYSELWRGDVEKWLDEEYVRRGLDPAVSRAASDALLTELESTTDSASREAWERLVELMQKDEGE